jgi:hypothetical protein
MCSRKLYLAPQELMMKKILLAVLALWSTTVFGQASVTTFESFDGATLTGSGWTVRQPNTATGAWLRRTNGANGTTTVCNTHSGAALARFSSRAFTNGYIQNFVSKKVDYTNRGTAVADVSFWMYRDSFKSWYEDSLTVFISTTDSLDITATRLGAVARSMYINLPDTTVLAGWYQYTFSVPASYAGSTNYFIFSGTSRTDTINQGCNIFLDDVSYIEYPPICAGAPNVGSVQAPNLICNGGDSIGITVTAPIGSNSLGVTYNWQQSSTGTAPWTTFDTLGEVTGLNLSASTYVQCTATCSYSGLSYTTPAYNIVVVPDSNPVVTIIPQSSVVCTGDTVYMVGNGAYSYTWSPAVAANILGDTVYATPTVNTIYTVVGTSNAGCTAQATQNIIVSNGPNVNITAQPNDTLCVGDTIRLNAIQGGGGGGGNTYLWSNGVTTRFDTISPLVSTVYSVVATNAAGCSRTGSIIITVLPAAFADFNFTISGTSVSVTDNSVNTTGVKYFFTATDSLVGDGTFNYNTPGIYTITQIATSNCGIVTITKLVNIFPEGLNDEYATQFNVYPNPTKDGTINILAAKDASVQVVDVLGHIVFTTQIKKNIVSTIDCSNFAKGIYTIRVGSTVKQVSIQ